MTSNRALCAVEPCFIPGSHARDCLERPGLHECPGCMPGLAMEGGEFDGSLICYHHHRQAVNALDRLEDLDDALRIALAPYRSPQAPKQPGTRSSEVPSPIASNVTAARQRLHLQLANMVAYVVVERGFHHPRNTIHDYVAFLRRNAAWLSQHPVYAPVWPAKMRELAGDAYRNAYPSAKPGYAMGQCPVEVGGQQCTGSVRYQPPGNEDDALTYYPTCPECGTAEPVSWWIQRMNATEPPERMAAPDMARWLSMELNVPIQSNIVRQWASRGQIEAVDRTKDGRPRYDREAVEEYARSPRVYNQPKTGASA